MRRGRRSRRRNGRRGRGRDVSLGSSRGRGRWRGGWAVVPGRGAGSVSRRLVDDPDAVFEVGADRCGRCERSLAGAQETVRVRRQVVDASPPPPPVVTEYQVISRRCGGCGHVSEPTAADVPRRVEPEAVVVEPEAVVVELEAEGVGPEDVVVEEEGVVVCGAGGGVEGGGESGGGRARG